MSKKIIVLSGSARSESVNKKVAALATKVLLGLGADARQIDLGSFDAPIYNGDVYDAGGLPEKMKELKQIVSDASALVISTPEYNGNMTPLLLNAFSWVSRPEGEGESPCAAFAGKTAAITSASPFTAGESVMPRLRAYLEALGVTVTEGAVGVASAYEAFNEDGTFTNPANEAALSKHLAALVAVLD